MNTPASPPGAERTDGSPVQIGALVPLTRPGWVEAGRHLLAGLELGAREVNDAGGIGGRPVELVVRDTAADPRRAAAAVDELARLGVAALAGEYHSVVARAAAAGASPGRRPGSGGTRSLPDPARRLSVPGAGGPGRHGAARTARPGRASLTSRASRTTRVPFTRTCRMPVVGRVLAE